MSKNKQNKNGGESDGGSPVTVDPGQVRVQAVTDLAALELLNAEAVVCDVLVKGNPYRFTGRRLVPAESKEVKLLLNRALPPLVAGEGEGAEPVYDFGNEEYQNKKEDNRRRARALVLWRCFPVFRERAEKAVLSSGLKPPVTTEEVCEFVEHLNLDDDILEALWRSATSDIADTQKFVNFILGNSSPQS